jgi:hypothetical protein
LSWGSITPSAPEIERAADPEPLRGLRADDRRHRRAGRCVEQAEEIALGRGPVLEVEDGPIEARLSTELDRER